jgi:hypothetical protein
MREAARLIKEFRGKENGRPRLGEGARPRRDSAAARGMEH